MIVVEVVGPEIKFFGNKRIVIEISLRDIYKMENYFGNPLNQEIIQSFNIKIIKNNLTFEHQLFIYMACS